MINVTKSYLPSIEEYNSYLDELWQSKWLTNRGKFVQKLEEKLITKLGVQNLLFVSNGTIALQLAIKVLELKGEIITTPFSYVATTTAILWENCKPVFCDIDSATLCIDASKIEALITKKTSAILATHVYGIPCDVEKIETIAKKYNLKVIYDGAHAFGVKYKNTSLLNYGDISTCSFHATKVFHTIEGGSVTCKEEYKHKLFISHTFGHDADEYFDVGINGKNSEFHAAMGLCNLKIIDNLIEARKRVSNYYDSGLNLNLIKKPIIPSQTDYNYSYYPVIFSSEKLLIKIKNTLLANEVNTRRYFYPSLNELPYLKNTNKCPVSSNISRRILCLPLYAELEEQNVNKIVEIINSQL